ARTMLIQAAAARWNVSAADCVAGGSAIRHLPSGRRLTFGAVAQEAAGLAVPQNPTLKSSSDLKLVGRSIPRVDVPSKVDGTAGFAVDVTLPGMFPPPIPPPPTLSC